jgi:hypothetical protein
VARYGRTLSENSTFYESKPPPPLPGIFSSNHGDTKAYQQVDVNGSVERILRLGHMWELDERVALNQAEPQGVVSW